MALYPTWLGVTRCALNAAERLMGWRLTVTGAEGLAAADGPRFYVANHFTRSETILLPFIIDRVTGRYPRTLADGSLFHGVLKRYFAAMGVVSTDAPDRDQQIIADLLTGRQDWVIYPEGLMMKTKQTTRKGRLMLTTAHRSEPPHTGAAVLALKAEIFRRNCFRALAEGDEATVEGLHARFGFGAGELAERPARIVPVTLTYHHWRPGPNAVVRYLRRQAGFLPHRLRDELEIEGNILLRGTELNIHFGTPIAVPEYLGTYRTISRWLPFFRSIDRTNPLLKRAARRLTTRAMTTVYHNLAVNLDHLVAGAILAWRGGDLLRVSHLRRVLYLAAKDLRAGGRVRLHPELDTDLARYLPSKRPWPALQSLLRLAESQGLLRRVRGRLYLDLARLATPPRFHHARRAHTLYVLANELAAQGDVSEALATLVNTDPAVLRQRVADCLMADTGAAAVAPSPAPPLESGPLLLHSAAPSAVATEAGHAVPQPPAKTAPQ